MDSAPLDPKQLALVISALRRSLHAVSRASGGLPEIPDSQIQVIRALPKGVSRSPSDLAMELHLDRSTISNLIATMTRSGLVARTPDANDKRRANLVSSDHARTLFAAFDQGSAEFLSAALDSLPFEEQRAIASALPALEELVNAVDTLRRSP